LKSGSEDLPVQNISLFNSDGFRAAHETNLLNNICSIKESLTIILHEYKSTRRSSDKNPFTVCPVKIMKKNAGFIIMEIQNPNAPDIDIFKSLVRIYQNHACVLVDNQCDTLTGLLNRKTFDDKIMKLIELQKPESRIYRNERREPAENNSFWLGIFDIDNFKRINDTFGHIYGDEILVLLARIMQEKFRSDDLKFRFGGEEFIVVIKTRQAALAADIFNRFREAVENYPFPQTGKVTISIGLTEITGSETPSVFVGCADKALYYAKENGKNMTCLYSDLVERGLIQPEKLKTGDITIFN